MKITKQSKQFEEYLKSIGGLVNGMFEDREPITERYFFSISDTWLPTVQHLIGGLIKLGWDKKILQVKEKFGGLRFYTSGITEEMHNLVTKAENEVDTICENCGEPGELRSGGWYTVLCDNCNN